MLLLEFVKKKKKMQHSYLGHSPGLLLKSKWCIHTVVLTVIVWKNSCYILSNRSDFHMVINLLLAVHDLSMHMFDITFSR